MIRSKIKKGDTVLIQVGKDRGKKGKVVRVYPEEDRVLVEGINMHVRHTRPRRAGEKGQRVNLAHPVPASRLLVVCPRCSKGTRVAYRMEGSSKSRICKKCGGDLS
ncbi:MAG: 50S ribosomal protein L24 [Patescibacteria group bacterium]